jgi:hypothetical protein
MLLAPVAAGHSGAAAEIGACAASQSNPFHLVLGSRSFVRS